VPTSVEAEELTTRAAERSELDPKTEFTPERLHLAPGIQIIENIADKRQTALCLPLQKVRVRRLFWRETVQWRRSSCEVTRGYIMKLYDKLLICYVIVGLHAQSSVGQNVLVFDDGGEHLIAEDLEQTVMLVQNASQLTVQGKVRAGTDNAQEIVDIAQVHGGSQLVVDGGELVAFEEDLVRYGVVAEQKSTVDILAGMVSSGIFLHPAKAQFCDCEGL
jgi:hypothetical protein